MLSDEALLSRVLSAVSMRTGDAIALDAPDRLVTIDLTARDVPELLARIARDEGLAVIAGEQGYTLRDPAEPSVTIDVVDAELGEILAVVKKQCGIKNVIVDPGVTGKGTFLFREVPCGISLRTILRTMALAVETYPSSVVRVKR